jgi:3-dehydroquinate synthase
MSKRIQLDTAQKNNHEILVGYGLEEEITEYLSSNFSKRKGVFIIDENVFRLYHDTFIEVLTSSFKEAIICKVPAGESSKNLGMYSTLIDKVLQSGIERATPIVVIGGGVTGDLGGFVAASCLRGMPLIHIPTSLLAMVDSSIGGKTGINHAVGKNLIGAFYQPEAVFTDLKFLETLPNREVINGLGEVIKYGMIKDSSIFELLKGMSVSDGFEYSDKWQELVYRCATIKVEIVSKDFKESGLREILNFGHTFAHVIERVGNYQDCSHGEAVFMGMWGAVRLSQLLGFNIDLANLSDFRSLFISKFSPNKTTEELTMMMLHDKKVKDGSIKVIILQELESAKTRILEDESAVKEAWKFLINEFK